MLQKFIAPESWCSRKGSAPKSQKNVYLTLIILGSVQVSVQVEQDEPKNEIAPASTLDKEVGKNENLGK